MGFEVFNEFELSSCVYSILNTVFAVFGLLKSMTRLPLTLMGSELPT